MAPLVMTRPYKVAAAGCLDRTSNSYWSYVHAASPGNATWNGSQWDLFQNAEGLHKWQVTGGWEVGQTWSSVDVTYTTGGGFLGDTWDFKFYDTAGNQIGFTNASGNGVGTFVVNIPLDFVTYGNDLGNGFGSDNTAFILDSFAYTTATIDLICFNA